MSDCQPAPISGNVINQILYLEIPENNSRDVDKCCTAGLGTAKIWSLCCCTIIGLLNLSFITYADNVITGHCLYSDENEFCNWFLFGIVGIICLFYYCDGYNLYKYTISIIGKDSISSRYMAYQSLLSIGIVKRKRKYVLYIYTLYIAVN